jgi:2-polyprenyl-3-methyl-5-hydroxy-6-metoxy-1,4-benzoquinol methylase
MDNKKTSSQKQNCAPGNEFDEDYFENGIATGKSCYTNYRWLPEMTIKFAHKIIKNLNLRDGDKVLDFGCAKGFLVKALRILDIDAYGCDISSYAIGSADDDVKDNCKLICGDIPFDFEFDWTISKDVFEHLTEEQLDTILTQIHKKSKALFVIVPLGENDKYVIPQYALDVTHRLAKSRDWWESKFEKHNWHVERFSYLMPGLKDNWNKYPKGNGFFMLTRR